MTNFIVTDILSSDTLRVKPEWKFTMRDGTILTGNRVKIRGLDADAFADRTDMILHRLRVLLIERSSEVVFSSPEPVDTEDHDNAIVSCSIYVARTNIMYYFPEFAEKESHSGW